MSTVYWDSSDSNYFRNRVIAMYINSWYKQTRPEMIWQVITAYQQRNWEQNYCCPILNARCDFCNTHFIIKKSPYAHFYNTTDLYQQVKKHQVLDFKKWTQLFSTLRKKNGEEHRETLLAQGFNSDTSSSYSSVRPHYFYISYGRQSSLKAPSIYYWLCRGLEDKVYFCSHIVLLLAKK